MSFPNFKVRPDEVIKPLQELEEFLSAYPTGAGATGKLSYWSDSDTLDDASIEYSGGKLGFGGASPVAFLDFDGADAPSGGKIAQIVSTQPTHGNFLVNYSANNVNGGDTHLDHVVNFGWNVASGGVLISGESALYLQFESHYRPGGAGDPREWVEWHLNIADYDDVIRRPLSIMGDKVTGSLTIVIQADNLNFVDNNSEDVLLQMTSGLFLFQSGASIASNDNDVPFIKQMNSASSGHLPLLYLDDTDTVNIGGVPTSGGVPSRAHTLLVNPYDQSDVTPIATLEVSTKVGLFGAVVRGTEDNAAADDLSFLRFYDLHNSLRLDCRDTGGGAVLRGMNGGSIRFEAAGGIPQISYNVDYLVAGSKYAANGFASDYFQSGGAHIFRIASSGSAGGAVTLNEVFRIDADGFVGIGISNPTYKLHVVGHGDNVGDGLLVTDSDTIATGFDFENTSSGGKKWRFQTVGSAVSGRIGNFEMVERASDLKAFVIQPNGNVGINGTLAWGASAAGVFGITNGTEPTSSPADMIQLYSVDLSAGNATLGLRTETAVVNESVVSDRTLSVRINGTTYKICLKS